MAITHQIFIGSSSEKIELVEAIQKNLSYQSNLFPICWNQGIFKLSNYPIEDLFSQLKKSAFAIFVLADDDITFIRHKKQATVRDNVLFEMGLYMGVLGKERTYFVVPKKTDYPFRIPSDLIGLNYANYTPSLASQNIDAMIAPACTQIKERINNLIDSAHPNLLFEKFGLFHEFDNLYSEYFRKSSCITTSFVHSRRWRENNLRNIDDFFKRKSSKWNVILPNIENKILLEHLQKHFDDGTTIEGKIVDAYDYFLKYQKRFPSKVFIHLFDLYPTYSLYQFDDRLIVSLYPLTSDRRPTPTFLLDMNTRYADFFQLDIDSIAQNNTPVDSTKLEKIVADYNSK